MLHKYIAGERDEKGLDFTEEDFFGRYNIRWMSGVRLSKVCPDQKEAVLDNGETVRYDKLLLATGANSLIPPVGELRKASNVFGLRDLPDAQAIVREAGQAQEILIIGSGLVGLDAAYGLLELGKKVTIVEMAPQILPVQLDEHGAAAYQELFEKAGVRFFLGRKADQAVCEADGRIHKVILDNGEEVACDMIIAAAGVRPCTAYLEGSGIACERGIVVDSHLPDHFCGCLCGRRHDWSFRNLAKCGGPGAYSRKNMCGIETEYTDTYAAKNTINFFGLVTLCIGKIRAEEGDDVQVREDSGHYDRVILRDGRVEGILLQGDISNAGIWQYLIKNKADISGIEKDVFHINYGDFYQVGERGKYLWAGI